MQSQGLLKEGAEQGVSRRPEDARLVKGYPRQPTHLGPHTLASNPAAALAFSKAEAYHWLRKLERTLGRVPWVELDAFF